MPSSRSKGNRACECIQMPSPVPHIPVAQDCNNPGDGWLPGEEARRRQRALYCPSDARLSGKMSGAKCWACSVCSAWERVCHHVPISSFCAILFKPPQFKLDPRLARLLGIHTQTRPVIIQALWQYIKTHKLQDPHEREYVICDKYLQQVMVAAAASAFLCEQPGIPGTELSAEPCVSGTDI